MGERHAAVRLREADLRPAAIQAVIAVWKSVKLILPLVSFPGNIPSTTDSAIDAVRDSVAF